MIEFIVSGIARSGTTALALALDLHPHVFCAIEHLRPADDHRDRFTPERILEDGHSGHLVRNRAALAEKESLLAIGNKHPGYFLRWDGVLDELSNGRAIFILREPHAIMASWNRRAANTLGGWPQAQTGAFAMLDMVEAIRQIHASRHVGATLYVSYEALFFGDRCQGVFEQLLNFLGVERQSAIARMFIEQLTNRETIAEHSKPIDGREAALVDALSIAPLLDAVHARGAALASSVDAEGKSLLRAIDGTASDIISRFDALFFGKPRFLNGYIARRSRVKHSVLFHALADHKGRA
jgi:hypothetical protein